MDSARRHKTYFLSDLHLGAGYIADRRAHESRVCRFLRSVKDDAKTVYLLGDVLDYWYEYHSVAPRGYLRFFGALTELADAGTEIVWFTGNHDIWLFDYLRTEIGLRVVDAPDGGVREEIDGTWFFLGHGDGIGRLKPSFRIIRKIFRNRLCQILYSAIHPRWTVGFAHSWSRHSRKSGLKEHSNEEAFEKGARESVERFAREYAEAHPEVRYIVIGHHHVLLREPAGPESDCELVVLGDWIDKFSYAVFDGEKLEIKRFSEDG